MNYNTLYISKEKKEKFNQLDQLLQLLRIVWDGDLISKQDRNYLVEIGYATQKSGFNIITSEGIEYLYKIKAIQA